jgi:hypothetical protein
MALPNGYTFETLPINRTTTALLNIPTSSITALQGMSSTGKAKVPPVMEDFDKESDYFSYLSGDESVSGDDTDDDDADGDGDDEEAKAAKSAAKAARSEVNRQVDAQIPTDKPRLYTQLELQKYAQMDQSTNPKAAKKVKKGNALIAAKEKKEERAVKRKFLTEQDEANKRNKRA